MLLKLFKCSINLGELCSSVITKINYVGNSDHCGNVKSEIVLLFS